jgi:uncharacterized protein YjgD (DUF1641 family)
MFSNHDVQELANHRMSFSLSLLKFDQKYVNQVVDPSNTTITEEAKKNDSSFLQLAYMIKDIDVMQKKSE